MPALDRALIDVTKAITDPRTGKSVYRVWKDYENRNPRLGRLGSGSDYTAFLDHAGVPSLDASFLAPAGGGTYHSAYDNADNVERHLDPGYLGHVGSARVAGVTALRLANADVLPLRYSDYASAVSSYVRALQAQTPVELRGVLTAAHRWRQAASRLEARASELLEAGATDSRTIARINAALMRQERALATSQGLPGRPWFRHRIYAPGLDNGYDVAYLPGLRDAIDRGHDRSVRAQRDSLVDSLLAATRLASRD